MESQIPQYRGLVLELNHTNMKVIFDPLSSKVNETLLGCKTKRDEFNANVRVHLDKRNEINRQVKELISEVQNQKLIRNEANSKVRELKKIRLERSNELKEIRTILRSSMSETNHEGHKRTNGTPSHKIRAAMNKLEWKHETGQIKPNKEKEFVAQMKKFQKEFNEATKREGERNSNSLRKVRAAELLQAEAHKSVEEAVVAAQDAHDLMIELSDDVDRRRDLANKEHIALTKTKREADGLHNQYIVSLRCIHSIQDILKLYDSKQRLGQDEERVEVSDLMSRLMSGDTLSTEELMLLQRG